MQFFMQLKCQMIWLVSGFKHRNLLLDCIILAFPLKLTAELKNNFNESM